MKRSYFSRLDDAPGDVQVPGLDGAAFETIVITIQQGDPLASSIYASAELLRELVQLARGLTGCTAWACTALTFPQHVNEFTGWGLARVSDVVSERPPFVQRIVWSRVPDPDASNWRSFWTAPMGVETTNIVLAQEALLNIAPPDQAVAACSRHGCTFVEWPWLGRDDQVKWLQSEAAALDFLILGVDDCELGIQVMARPPLGVRLLGLLAS